MGWEQLDYPTFLESRRSKLAAVVREGFTTLWEGREEPPEPSIEDLLHTYEAQTLEYKATSRWDLGTGRKDPVKEHKIVKTVCGFLNAEGGMLLVGVDDDGRPVGLDHDFATLGKKADADGFELFLRQLLDDNLSVATAKTVRISFPVVEGKVICWVAVAASGVPVYAKPVKGTGSPTASQFWVRVGNATRQLHGDDQDDYKRRHWG